jgi:Sec-independent protein translocase protein TatA
VLLLLVLFFGARKMAGLTQGIGKGIREFRKSVRDNKDSKKIPGKKTNVGKP